MELDKYPKCMGLSISRGEGNTLHYGRAEFLTKHDFMLMDQALREALCSTANKGLVGAIAALDTRPLLGAYNGTLPGSSNVCEDESGNTLQDEVLHAEENLVCLAAKHGISFEGASLYVTRRPCKKCINLVISAGFKEIFYIEDKGDERDLHLLKATRRGIGVTKINPYYRPENTSRLYLYKAKLMEEGRRRIVQMNREQDSLQVK